MMPAESVVATGGMIHFLQRLLDAGQHRFDEKGVIPVVTPVPMDYLSSLPRQLDPADHPSCISRRSPLPPGSAQVLTNHMEIIRSACRHCGAK